MSDVTLSPRVGVLGAGYWGQNLVRNFNALNALAAVCDTRTDVVAKIRQLYPHVDVYLDPADLLAARDIHAVAIATPAATHGHLVARALDAGKHVFVEKPLCLDVHEAVRLKQAAEEKGLHLMVGHLMLYHPAFQRLKAAVDGGELGTICYIYSNRLSLGKIRREENALWSFAPHDISMILSLIGAMPIYVSASGANFLSSTVSDTTLSHLQFPSNAQAHVFVSWLHPFKDQKLVVVGERAMAVFNDVVAGPERLLLYRHKARWDGNLPLIAKADAELLPHEQDEPLKRECLAFLGYVRNGAAVASDASEGIRVLKVLAACQMAMQSGGRVRVEP